MNKYFATISRKVDGTSSVRDCLPAQPSSVAEPSSLGPSPPGSPVRHDVPEPLEPAVCTFDCCKLDSPSPCRLEISKDNTARAYGKRKRYFQDTWLDWYKWLVLCKTRNKAFCQVCRYAIHLNLVKAVTAGNGRDVFFGPGYCDWKKGCEKLKQHDESQFHEEARLKVNNFLNATPIIETFNKATAEVHAKRRACLLKHIDGLIYLSRNNIPMRNSNEVEGNLYQYLLRSSVPGMTEYLADRRYLSPTISSELLKLMYREVLTSLLENIKASSSSTPS